jgi:hypothetical protein
LPLSDSEAGFRKIISGYRSRAKRKGLPFTLTAFEAKILLTSRCSLCGVGPQRYWNRHGATADSGYPDLFEANGIDRIDSALGYTTDNTRPACFQCNRAKSDLTDYAFRSWVRDVYYHLDLGQP